MVLAPIVVIFFWIILSGLIPSNHASAQPSVSPDEELNLSTYEQKAPGKEYTIPPIQGQEVIDFSPTFSICFPNSDPQPIEELYLGVGLHPDKVCRRDLNPGADILHIFLLDCLCLGWRRDNSTTRKRRSLARPLSHRTQGWNTPVSRKGKPLASITERSTVH